MLLSLSEVLAALLGVLVDVGATATPRSAYDDPAMRRVLLVALLGCRSSESKPSQPVETSSPHAVELADANPTHKPPDEMDERMRHCPPALEGATSTFENIEGGVRFTIKVPDAAVNEARRRAYHIVDFAAKRTRAGHGGFDGKGGGRMRNCPVVTDDVTITATDIEGGAQLDIIATTSADALRAETRERVKKFPFVGATITPAH